MKDVEFKQLSPTEIHVTTPVGNLLNPNKEPLTMELSIPAQGGDIRMKGHNGPLGFIGDNLKVYKYPLRATKQIFMHQVQVQVGRQYRLLEKVKGTSQELEWNEV